MMLQKHRYLQDKFDNVDTIQPDSCFHFHYKGMVEDRDYDNKPIMKEQNIEKHFDFRLNGSTDVENNSSLTQPIVNMDMLYCVMK